MDNETKTPQESREPEVQREFKRMNEEVESLISITQVLEGKLKPVLTDEPPKSSEEKDEVEASTDFGKSLREFSNKINGEASKIRTLLDRLEI